MKRLPTITILFLLFSISLFAQTIGGSFMLGSPQKEFRKNVDRLGYGFQAQGTLWSPGKERPFSIGLDGGYMIYGEVSERRQWPGFPGIFLDLSRTNSIANLHLLFQISPFTGTVRLYGEGLFGGAYIFTQSEVKSENSTQAIATSTNFDDFTWSYGGGVGLLIKLSENLEGVQTLYLDVKARYIFGTEAQYLTEESVFVNALGDTIFRSVKSKTDLLTFHIGVVAYFN